MSIKIDQIIRSNRKTIALQITEDGLLIVRAPLHLDEEKIRKVVIKHKKWIEEKKKEIERKDPKFSKKEFVNGEGFLYLGKYYKLYIVKNQSQPLRFENGFYLSESALSKAKEIFIEWYKKQAFEKISERVSFYASVGGFKYKKINITSAMKRWGSCSPDNSLNFSWRLIMAPLPVIDYVVVHELAHTLEKNHSKNFWSIVKMLMPNYKKQETWLKENGHLLRL